MASWNTANRAVITFEDGQVMDIDTYAGELPRRVISAIAGSVPGPVLHIEFASPESGQKVVYNVAYTSGDESAYSGALANVAAYLLKNESTTTVTVYGSDWKNRRQITSILIERTAAEANEAGDNGTESGSDGESPIAEASGMRGTF